MINNMCKKYSGYNNPPIYYKNCVCVMNTIDYLISPFASLYNKIISIILLLNFVYSGK